ncbi:RHS repeat-associated core domain-containing protein [Pseudomonas nunensis]|uniref:RHS repeat-associated core domain-containing protein n=1 Tax=Pseudomonas nunensis TaxID=2961896 RepID=UPI0025B18CDF|nr:RHS repeat-associated core domain-containing protein [Pseudomonas nunensis]MDN3219122.1 RHS repeat-associated core domain-containing protein [Pseudomonas nunensis]
MNTTIDRHTPTLTVTDSRGLAVRQLTYYRGNISASAQPRMNIQTYDSAGRLVASRDPRLQQTPAARANLLMIYSLSGAALSSDSVDAGWRLGLPGEAQQALENWDGRGSHQRSEYDAQLRPVARYESLSGEPARTVERLSYANNTAEFAARNQCGQLLRHDDPAGTLLFNQQALTGEVISQTRRFLPDEQAADWPLDIAARDTLLEPDKRYTTLQRYSPVGEWIVQTDAGEHQQRRFVDCAGQLKGIALTLKGKPSQPLLTATQYNAEGQLLSQTAGNGVVTTATFEASTGRLTRLSAAAPGKGVLQDLSYEYNPVGNISRLQDHTQAVRFFANQRVVPENTYTYDSLYQLISATGQEAVGASIRPGLPDLISPIDPSLLLNYTEEYEYDAGGNFTELRHRREGNNYTRTMRVAQGSNRALPGETDGPAPEFERQFDANGNLQTLVPGAQPMVWDGRNQLQKLTTVNRADTASDSEYYRYDSGGARVRKVSSAQARAVAHQRQVRYLPGLEIRTLDASEELQVISVALGRGSVRCLHWVTGKPADIEADQTRYSLDDHLGSCSLELDKTAAVISHEGYYPYGGTAWWAARSKVEADYKTIRYSGKEQDDSGLVYYGLRYLAPWLGRWINPDPLGAVDGLNFYRMVRNNPINFMDDTGGAPTDPAVSIEMNDLSAEPVFFGPNLPENPQDNPPPMPNSWPVWRRKVFGKDYWKEKTKGGGLAIANSSLARFLLPPGGTNSMTPWIISTAGTVGTQALTNYLHPNPAWTVWNMWTDMPPAVSPDDPEYEEYQKDVFDITQHRNKLHTAYVMLATVTGSALGPLHTYINKRVDKFRDDLIKASKAATKAQGAERMGRIEQEMLTLKLNNTVTEEAQNLLISDLLLAEKELGSSSPQTVDLLERLRAMGPRKGYVKDYIPDDFGRRSNQGSHRLGGESSRPSRLLTEYGSTRL